MFFAALMGLGIALFSLYVIVIGLSHFITGYDHVTWAKTEGRVADVRFEAKNANGAIVVVTTLSYQVDGQPRIGTLRRTATGLDQAVAWRSETGLGQAVVCYYQRKNPEVASLDGHFPRMIIPGIFSCCYSWLSA